MRRTAPVVGTLVIALALVPIFAMAAESDQNEAANAAPWSLSVGGLLDNKQGSSFDGSVGYSPSKATKWLVDANHSDSPSSVADVKTNAALLSFSHDGEMLGFSLGGHWFNDVDIVTAKEAAVGLTMRFESWHIGLNGEYRQSDFDPFKANTTVKRRDGTLVPVAATTTCSLDNSGYGAEVGIDGDQWRTYVKGMKYHYGENDCSFDSPGLNALRKTNAREFTQLANVLTRRLSKLAVSHLRKSNENSFLDSEIDAGVKFSVGTAVWGLDYQHGREQFEGLTSNTYTASVDFDVFKASDIALQVGASDSESIDTVTFIGATITTRF